MDPSAPELSDILLEHQNWSDRPMEVCRIFVDKLAELVKDITEREILGPVKAWFHSLEHQKRFLFFILLLKLKFLAVFLMSILP